MNKTCDPDVLVEECRPGFVIYRRITDGGRWSVTGFCDQRGDCLVGAVIDTPDGPVQVRDHAHIDELKRVLRRERIDFELDVPVGVGFRDCCPLEVVEL